MLWLKCCDKLGEMVYFHHSTKVVYQDSRDDKVVFFHLDNCLLL